ncbi:MAG: MFS transporter [Oscillospiraceae bacterium]
MRNNEMINYLVRLKGNPKICILTEPLWFIPYSLYAPFATIFMYSLGVDDVQIGFLMSFGMIVQVVAAFFGGVITDKLGRRLTTILADLISWSIPCLIWTFAQNFWWFLAAIILNSVWQISNISWGALLVEDSKEDELVYAYSWINIASVLSVFVSPISFALMQNFDPVFIVRYLYFFSFISMTIKFLLLFFKGHETEQGKKRMEETKNVSMLKMMSGYKEVFLKIIKSGQMRFALFVMLTFNISSKAVSEVFFGLYTTQKLELPQSLLAIFQMIGAIFTLLIMFTLQNKLNRLPYKPVMVVGYILFIANNLLLVLSPAKMPIFLILYTIINSFATACILPRKDSLSARFVDKKERARVNALMYMIMIGITSPFGIFAGWLSSMNRSYPFILNILLFVIALIAVSCSKEIKKLDEAMA